MFSGMCTSGLHMRELQDVRDQARQNKEKLRPLQGMLT